MENKTDATLQILSIVPREELISSGQYIQLLGFDNPNNWQIIVKYNGDIERVAQEQGGTAQLINSQFALMTLPPENIKNLLGYTQVEYMETPKRMVFTTTTNMQESCITTVQNNPPYNLKGEGVLLGIIDSGIQYAHPDFRNADGTTRITSIWDQNIPGNPPRGFKIGTEYTREQINEALRAPTREDRLRIVPSEDTNGHGTHVAGIAGGNGRGSNGQIIGAAPASEFIIVKLGQPGNEDFVRNSEIMLGVKYVIEKAIELGRPVAINISIGMNSGPHDGQSLIEQYLDDAATLWKTSIVVGTGNEGNARSHTMGRVQQGKSMAFQFQIGPNTLSYNVSVWKSFIDTFEFEIIDPAGRRTPRIPYAQGPVRYSLSSTQVYATYAGPSPLNGDEEFVVFLTTSDGKPIVSGPWSVLIYGIEVVDGLYNAWGPTVETGGQNSFMLEPIVETTLTTPSTSRLVISVGAYNSVTNQLAPFSGRGFGRNGSVIKPDLVAPGVEIMAPSNQGSGYRTLSGTSMATPHVTGGVALLMEWGIVKRNNVFLYGENLKTYLLRGANRQIADVTFPSPNWGYGKLCIRETLDLLRRQLLL
ncbi:peptidase S8 and S53 subtilisin kexin sedolisin [Sporanaerobium hydrogeniformans]|uniref:Peptidase S8 and S53 subtilisin kexin sedolisin n=1 Tax=Sporanaerobium hydrogeniformans TaxID=3072179 RepID=A0AC61DH74_9FIRM|nr:S8 family peptidase [Sporanaerobium hydrogeniformans]PHV72318.1 peptidase S8 and S53 subtilisin kexin sedolisin [Sporanaerobium hydrogeniformans]